MQSQFLRKFGLCVVLCASAFAACDESPTEPSDPRPLVCPTDQTLTRSEIITPLGGLVSVGGTSISIPQGALEMPTVITVTVPASAFMEIDITANGLTSFLFNQAVEITIDYSRCPDALVNKGPLSVWYWERDSGELLENMNGVDFRLQHRMVFTTTHLSGYVIAN